MPDSRRSLAGAIAVSFSLSATLLLPTTAQAVSDDVAMQLLQRLDQLEGEVRDLRGENEVLRDRLGNLPSSANAENKPAAAKSDGVDPDVTVTPTDNSPTPRLNLSLPDVEKDVDKPAVTATSTSRADGAERASAVADKADAQDDTDKLIAELNKEPEKQPTSRVSPTSPDSYFTYGEQGKKELEKSAVRPMPKPEATVTVASAEKIVSKKDEQSTVTKPATEKVTKAVDSTEKQARMAYNDAYKLLLDSPADAVTSFRNFLNNYPKHRLTSNAQYWLGEALYAQKDYSGASVEFMKVLKAHKDSDKAPGAALKLGFSFYELKQWELARRTLEDTKRFFPNNSVAQLAQSRLTKMDAEGH